jgi:CBS domain-containing protein
MLTAKDIMKTDVIWVKKQTPIYEVGVLLIKKGITDMPIVEDDMTLAGIIREKDILRLCYADAYEKNKAVEDFMTQLAVHYRESESLKTICDFMMINRFREIPITSTKNQVVGIISMPDILNYILQSRAVSKGQAQDGGYLR